MRPGLFSIVILMSIATSPSYAAPKSAPKAASKIAPRASPKLIQSCDAHKFETVVDSMVDGQPHQSKVRLCGVEGQSDAEWIDTLRDAVKKLDTNKQMHAAQRDQIVTAIKTEIARLTILGAGPVMPKRGSAAVAKPPEPLSRDYAMLPPLPPPRAAEPQPKAPAELPSGDVPSGAVQNDFAHLPPLPPPISTESSVAAPAAIPAVAPRLSFGCDSPGDLSTDAPCAEFERETTLSIHAAEDVAAGTLLQFVRNDKPQADVALGGLRRGGVLRIALPAKVCTGFATGKLELRIVHQDANGLAQPLGSEGPYSLHC